MCAALRQLKPALNGQVAKLMLYRSTIHENGSEVSFAAGIQIAINEFERTPV